MHTPLKRRLVYLLVMSVAVAFVYSLYLWHLHDDVATGSKLIIVSGNIEAHESVLGFKSVQSRIVELPFTEGQWVARDTVVAKLDDSDYQQQIVIAEAGKAIQQQQVESAEINLGAADKTVVADEAALAQREIDYHRNRELSDKRFVSAAALDLSRTAVRVEEATLARDRALREVAEKNISVAKAGLRNSEELLKLAHIVHGYTVLKAPIDGVITVRQAELGEIVVPGTPVVSIADLDHVWLRAYLNETDLGKVALGQPVEVKTDNDPQKTYPGTISFIASKAEFTPKSVETHVERVTLVYRIKIDIRNVDHKLVPGMPADAVIRRNETNLP